MVAEKDVVYEKFPIPLINRLEKHFLAMETMLTEDQRELADELQRWAEQFSAAGRHQQVPRRGNRFLYPVFSRAILAVVTCLSVRLSIDHTPVLCQNG